LQRYIEVIGEVEGDLSSSIRMSRHSKQVFPGINVKKVDAHAKRAADMSKQLHRGLAKDSKSVETAKTETSIANIKEAARSARTEIQARWAEQITIKVEGYSSLVGAANEAKLGGSTKLQRTLAELLAKAYSPPVEDGEAEAVNLLFRRLVEDVSGLGLSGDAGNFLVQAAAGKGDPKWLEKPEVRAMLDKHNLWRILHVTLR
jgi:hypothetical protein